MNEWYGRCIDCKNNIRVESDIETIYAYENNEYIDCFQFSETEDRVSVGVVSELLLSPAGTTLGNADAGKLTAAYTEGGYLAIFETINPTNGLETFIGDRANIEWCEPNKIKVTRENKITYVSFD